MKPKQLSEELIRYRTITGNKEEISQALEHLKKQFGADFNIKEFEKEGVKSLLIASRKTEEIDVILHGHIDVVDAEEELFRPRKRGGKLFGRGATDMKSGVACITEVMKEIENQGLGLLITSDEEKGGFNGTGYVLEKEELSPELVISAEPDDSGDFPSIVNKQKGVLQLKISVEGESAHASKPEKGESAAEELIRTYREKIRPLFEPVEEFATTVNLSKINAGDAVNRVPDHAEMDLDIRYSENYPKNQVLGDIRDIEDLNVEITAEAPMMKTDSDNEMVKSLKKSVQKVSGKETDTRKEAFASDMRFFTEKGIPAICFGPEGYNLHGKNEYVVFESLELYCEILKNFLESELN